MREYTQSQLEVVRAFDNFLAAKREVEKATRRKDEAAKVLEALLPKIEIPTKTL